MSDVDTCFHLNPAVQGQGTLSAHHALVCRLHTVCQFGNRHLADTLSTRCCQLCMFNTVWPRVKHEMSLSYFIMLLQDSPKNSADISACWLIWHHQTQISRFSVGELLSITAVTSSCLIYLRIFATFMIDCHLSESTTNIWYPLWYNVVLIFLQDWEKTGKALKTWLHLTDNNILRPQRYYW